MTDRSFYYNWGKVDLLKISGKDTKDFLQRLSTQNFKKPFEALHGAFLTGQAKFISLFTAWEENTSIYFFIEPSSFEKTWGYLNQMHFAEDLKIEKESAQIVEARGPEKHIGKTIPAFNWGIEGIYILNSKDEFQALSSLEFDFLRAQFVFPKPTIDLIEDNILIESAHLEKFIDRNKGCYPGQEVIEKVYTYGRVAQKILKIEFSDLETNILLPADLLNEKEEKVGVLTSLYKIEGTSVGIGRVKRMHYEQNCKCYVGAVKSGTLGTIV